MAKSIDEVSPKQLLLMGGAFAAMGGFMTLKVLIDPTDPAIKAPIPVVLAVTGLFVVIGLAFLAQGAARLRGQVTAFTPVVQHLFGAVVLTAFAVAATWFALAQGGWRWLLAAFTDGLALVAWLNLVRRLLGAKMD